MVAARQLVNLSTRQLKKDMIDYFTSHLWLLWSIAAIVCLTLEMTSGDFFLTCFAIGAIGSTLAAAVGVPLWLQVLVFAIVSVLSIFLLRPRLTQMLHKGGHDRPSNTDALIGRIGTVSQPIPAGGYGRVKLDGDDWKATSTDADLLQTGMRVRIIGRDSVIVTVESVD